jgi:hypothetical protein
VKDPRARSGMSVVKVWCVPLMKAKQRGLAKCAPNNIIRQIKLLTAQQKITSECGLQDIVPKLWMESVDGVIPGGRKACRQLWPAQAAAAAAAAGALSSLPELLSPRSAP